MLKNIKIYSVVALAILVIGCGSDSDKKKDVTNFVKKSSEKVTMDKLRSLGGDKNISQFIDSGVSKSANKFIDSGKKDIGFNEECINIIDDEKTSIFSANDCTDGDVAINGRAKISGDDNGGTFEILQDFTAKDGVFSFFAKKGSKISMNINQQTGSMTFTANFQATVDNENFSANNLTIVISENKTNNGGSFHIQKGEVNVGNLYFKVDPRTTPIVVDDSGLVSGVIKLTDGYGQKMEMKVETFETISLKIDKDGNGEFSESETITENIEDFFDDISKEYDKY